MNNGRERKKTTCKDFAEYLKKCAEVYAKHGSRELTNSDGEYQDILMICASFMEILIMGQTESSL